MGKNQKIRGAITPVPSPTHHRVRALGGLLDVITSKTETMVLYIGPRAVVENTFTPSHHHTFTEFVMRIAMTE
jgi:hypothetical protein